MCKSAVTVGTFGYGLSHRRLSAEPSVASTRSFTAISLLRRSALSEMITWLYGQAWDRTDRAKEFMVGSSPASATFLETNSASTALPSASRFILPLHRTAAVGSSLRGR